MRDFCYSSDKPHSHRLGVQPFVRSSVASILLQVITGTLHGTECCSRLLSPSVCARPGLNPCLVHKDRWFVPSTRSKDSWWCNAYNTYNDDTMHTTHTMMIQCIWYLALDVSCNCCLLVNIRRQTLAETNTAEGQIRQGHIVLVMLHHIRSCYVVFCCIVLSYTVSCNVMFCCIGILIEMQLSFALLQWAGPVNHASNWRRDWKPICWSGHYEPGVTAA